MTRARTRWWILRWVAPVRGYAIVETVSAFSAPAALLMSSGRGRPDFAARREGDVNFPLASIWRRVAAGELLGPERQLPEPSHLLTETERANNAAALAARKGVK